MCVDNILSLFSFNSIHVFCAVFHHTMTANNMFSKLSMGHLILLFLVLAPLTQAGDLLTKETIARRRLARFKVGDPENLQCWERHGVDGFLSVIDAHNHFR